MSRIPEPDPRSKPLDPRPLAPALAAAEAAGWTTLRLDLDGVRGKTALMRSCARALRAPEWFGANWDALADTLRDLSWLPPAPGRLIAVTSWQGYAHERPDDWETLREVLEEAVDFWRDASVAGEGAPLTVLAADGARRGHRRG
ncbi:barstar family protein [Streptomyces sp. NPDC088097]|uniref:barstar family protein n=1 Tax=Streptomyces sp. NPDC088097 TaxID=3365823 RepID=UPI0037F2C818